MAIRRESLRAPSFVRHRRDTPRSAGPAHVAYLLSEAHRLAHRRAVIEAACCQARAEGRASEPMSEARRRRLVRRGTRLMVAFHAVLDRLYAANGFDEALVAFRAYQSERDRRQKELALAAMPARGPRRSCEPSAVEGGRGERGRSLWAG
jgi:hypothetical protein